MRSARRNEILVAGAFAVAVAVLILGAWAVWRAGERHRRTADEALQDQASYMAGMVASIVTEQGWFSARTMLRAWDETMRGPGPLPTTDSIRRRAAREAIGPDMVALVPRRFFAGDNHGWRGTDGPELSDDTVLSVVRRSSIDTLPDDGMFRMMVIPHGADTSLIFLMAAWPTAPGLRWYGFEVGLTEFRNKIILPRVTSLAYSFRHLRDSLRQRQPDSDSLPPVAISIVTDDNRLLYSTPVRPHPPWIGSRKLTGGLASTVTLSVEPAAVPILMQGGYPSNSAAAIAVTFALGVLLLGAAATLAWRTLAISRQREEFTSSVSHELRTPLTNIQLFAETLLLDRARTVDEQRGALETITRETRRLVHIVENVLALSRLGRTMTVVRRPERIDQLVRDVVSSFDPLLRSHDISVEVALDGHETASVDGDAVRRILVNLLDNAVRYGPEGQTLRISASNRDGRLELAVQDQGPGIPTIDRERIWQPFERGSTNVNGGTGIGLAVVHQLVKLHGGTVRIDTVTPGARFVVILPGVDTRSGASTHA
jgi:signal transduction histidine kinase